MKKLLIMASLFWPQKNSGGPPISIMNLVQSIKGKFDVYIISKNHELNDDKPLEGIKDGWNQFEFGKAYYVRKGEHTFKNIANLISEVSPDVIYQNSFFSMDDLLPVLFYKKKHKSVKVIVAPRGELYPERFQCGHAKKSIYSKVFRYSGLLKDVYFQGTGEEECLQEKTILGIPDNRILDIQNLSIISGDKSEHLEKTSGEIKLVYIARIHPTKNTLKAIQYLSQAKGNVQYDIYGSIEDDAYWEQCTKAIEKLPDNVKVNYFGVVNHDKVSSIITNYHAYYMPTSGENFGHSIVEAMLFGKMVIISDQTPWTDVNNNGGYAVALGNDTGFIDALNSCIDLDDKQYTQKSDTVKKYIESKLNINQIVQQYVAAFGE